MGWDENKYHESISKSLKFNLNLRRIYNLLTQKDFRVDFFGLKMRMWVEWTIKEERKNCEYLVGNILINKAFIIRQKSN